MSNTARFSLLTVSLLTALSLSGCGGGTDAELAAGHVTARKVGSVFELDQCKVQAYRVKTVVQSSGANVNIPDATLFTADCPTAQTTSSAEVVGKNSVAVSARVAPKLRAAGVSSDSTVAGAADEARQAELLTQVSRLKMQQADLAQQLTELEARLKR